MKRLHSLNYILTLIIFGCDVGESMEVLVMNSSSQPVKVNFVSEINELNKSLEIDPNQRSVYLEFQSNTSGVFLSFVDNDSIYIQSSSNEILKVFKQKTAGKNIYNVDEYWSVEETSKNHFVYTYEITDDDFE